MEDEIKLIETNAFESLPHSEIAVIDSQIATAKKYPRDVTRAKNNSIAIATMDKETAETCGYTLPRGGKHISGPSVHLAKIIAQNWGNMRIEAKVVNVTQTQLVSNAMCLDLENNLAVKVEVIRKITDRYGKRFNDDMITVTGNAANSIALRNAVFAVVPKGVVNAVYSASKNYLSGDLSTEEKLIKARKQMFEYFKENYKATEEEVLNAIGVNATGAVKQDHILIARGIIQALKDNDTTPDDVFDRHKKKTPMDKKKELKKESKEKTEMP